MKHWLEDISVELGFGGEINEDVMDEAQDRIIAASRDGGTTARRMRRSSFRRIANRLVVANFYKALDGALEDLGVPEEDVEIDEVPIHRLQVDGFGPQGL